MRCHAGAIWCLSRLQSQHAALQAPADAQPVGAASLGYFQYYREARLEGCLPTDILHVQALRIWHAAIASLRRQSAHGAITAISAAECGAAALEAVVAQYGSHPMTQVSELDRLLLSVCDDDHEEAPPQSCADSPEQAGTS